MCQNEEHFLAVSIHCADILAKETTRLIDSVIQFKIQDSNVFICHIQDMQRNVCVTYSVFSVLKKNRIKYK